MEEFLLEPLGLEEALAVLLKQSLLQLLEIFLLEFLKFLEMHLVELLNKLKLLEKS